MLGHFTHEPPPEPLMPTLVLAHEDPDGQQHQDGRRWRYHICDRTTGREWAGVEGFDFKLRRHWDQPQPGVFQPGFATVAHGTVRLRGDAKFETNDVEIQWIAGGRAACALCQKGAAG